jgi:DNA-binding MarR family transcriptional regulator
MTDILMVKGHDSLLQATRALYEAMFRFDAQAAALLGLHVTDLRCVNALESGPLSPGEIGTRLALTSGSVTALVNRLETAGYAARVADPADGRRWKITLTPLFRARADAVYARLGMAIGQSFREVDASDMAKAPDMVARLADAFGAALPAQATPSN